MPPLMATGDIDGLAFIGGSKAADDLVKKHPEPHRLKLFLQLEAKNMAVSCCLFTLKWNSFFSSLVYSDSQFLYKDIFTKLV